jgi:uncharacterized protein (DUF305 family)
MQMGQGGGMDMIQMMAMMQTMHPAIAVDGTAVYIVRGSQVLKLDKNTLQIIATGMLPAPAGMQGGMGAAGTECPGMQDAMGNMGQAPSGQFDQMFLQNMIRHHSGAIEMSKPVVERAVHPELRRFAQGVISRQSDEIMQFSTWLRDWYNTSAPTTPMPADQSMIDRLRNLSGRDLEVQYMQMMIRHHQEAIQMSRMAQQRATHPELKTAASRIITTQSAEIRQLSSWLSTWYGVR